MPKLMFAWLGSGRARRRNVGPAGYNLDQAARAGLPVPPGAVLLDEFYRFALDNDLAAESGQRIVVNDPLSLHATLFESVRLPRFERPVKMQPIAAAPDTGLISGFSEAEPVDSRNPEQFCRALAHEWSVFDHGNPSARHDVLLVETVDATAGGTAMSYTDATLDTIQEFAHSDGEGEEAVVSAELPRLSGWRFPDENLPPRTQRLQMLLRGVRRTLGRGDWVVTWADDGNICWLLDVHELTRALH